MSRGTGLSRGLMVGCLALIGWMVWAAPVHADERTISDTTLEQFNAGAFYHTGLTRYGDGEVQLLVAGIAGEWIADTNTTGLPALQRHTAVRHGDHILVIGGRDASPAGVRTVYYTTIDPLTHDLAKWQPTTALPSATYPNGLFWHTSVVVHDRVYVLGGTYDESNNYDHVLSAPINEDGTLGSWTATTSLPVKLRILQAAVVNDRIYVIGGRGEGNEPHKEVYYSTPNPNTGVIDSWTQTTADFPHEVFGHMVAVHEDKMYVMGGYPRALGDLTTSPYAHFATPDPTSGDISGWTQVTDMSNNLYGGAGISLNGVLFTTGGAYSFLAFPSDYVGTSFIADDGAIGSWLDTSLITPARYWHATVASRDGWLYVIHGSSGANPIASINRGTTSGDGDQYAPDGTFTSATMDLKASNKLKRLAWNSTLPDPTRTAVNLSYRSAILPGDWTDWSAPVSSQAVAGPVTTTLSLSGNARYFQYRTELSTQITNTTPSLNAVQLTYEVPAYLVSLVKGSEPGPGSIVKPGSLITYSLTYINPTEGMTATNAYILDLVPENTVYVPGSITGTGAIDTDPTNLRWDVGTVKPGDEGIVSFAVRVSDTLTQTTVIQNEAQILSDSGPARRSNLVEHTVEPLPYLIDLTKDAVPVAGSTIKPGTVITYALTYMNPTEGLTATNAHILDLVPENTTYVPGSITGAGAIDTDPTNLRWDVGTINPGDEGVVGFAVQVNDNLTQTTVIQNEAQLLSNSGPTRKSNMVEHTVEPFVYSLDLTKSALPTSGSTVQPGDKIIYTIDYVNTGETALLGCTLADLFVPEDEYTILSTDPAVGSPPAVWTLGTLEPDDAGQAQLAIQLADIIWPKDWVVTNQAVLESVNLPVQTSNVVSHVVSMPGQQYPDLVIDDIKWNPTTPQIGAPVQFHVKVANRGDVGVSTPFFIELYIKPAPSTPPTSPSDHDLGYCVGDCSVPREDFVEAMAALPVSQDLDDGFWVIFSGSEGQLVFPSVGDYTVYAQIDVAFSGDDYHALWGAQAESNETNNIRAKGLHVGPPRIYLPVIHRNSY